MPPVLFFLWVLAGCILLIIIREGAKEDVMTRIVTSIDRFKYAFFASVLLPFVWFSHQMISNGLLIMFLMNLLMIVLFWACGKLNIIGGADAYVVMMCGILFPFVFPIVLCFGLSAFAVRFCRSEHNAEDWERRGIPYFVTLRYGYALTIPLGVLFAASLFF
ncbi:MAG TPA: hypothetical protein O0X48_04105 [Methanocorpusculum sp.]|nr:hypothetical protein [Methanocorpusculum sp.]